MGHSKQSLTQVCIIEHGSNPDQACSSARDNRHILPTILGLLSLSVVFIVEPCNSSSQRLDTSCRPIFTPTYGDVDCLGSFETAFDIVVDFGSTLAQIGPVARIILEAMLVCSFRAPDYACGSSRGIQAGMRPMPCMSIAKLTMYLALVFTVSCPISGRAFSRAFPYSRTTAASHAPEGEIARSGRSGKLPAREAHPGSGCRSTTLILGVSAIGRILA